MWDYPTKLKLGVLLAESQEFTALKPHLERISLLTKGGWELREALSQFIKQRPGEEPAIYRARLEKFTYSNVMGSAIAQLATKFSNGTVFVENATPESFWADFREDNSGQGRTEMQLVCKLLSSLLPYQKVFAHIDKPTSEIEPVNAAQEAMLGLLPRVVLYDALQVPSYSERDGRLEWVKVFQLSEDNSDPTRKPLMQATWTFIDSETIARYSAYVKLKGGVIVDILDSEGEPIGIGDESEIFLDSEVWHGFGRVPVVKVEIPADMWGGNQAYPKAEESLRLECHRYDYLTATYPQRTFKKVMTPDDDLDTTYTDAASEPMPTGLQYVLELDSFTWNEPTGAILDKVTQALEQATKDIRSILAVGGAYIQEPAAEISGKSKEMDFETEENRLESYGHIICDGLQDIYQLVAIAQGYPHEAIAVTGLDDFGRSRLNELIQSLLALLSIDMGALERTLTPTLYMLVREKLMGFLMANLTPDQKEQVKAELAIVPVAEEPEIEPESV
jgi:hypothetical protein